MSSPLWTTLEDRTNLDIATMNQASIVFMNWAETAVKEKKAELQGPRYTLYIYVNDESIESIINPARSAERSGNFLVLVVDCQDIELSKMRSSFENTSLSPNARTELQDFFADDGDDSWKLICAKEIETVYLDAGNSPNGWYNYSDRWQGPPYVHYRFPFTFEEESLIKNPDPTGIDVYRMMKTMYGRNHERSVCSENQEAKSKLQRLRGYQGGF